MKATVLIYILILSKAIVGQQILPMDCIQKCANNILTTHLYKYSFNCTTNSPVNFRSEIKMDSAKSISQLYYFSLKVIDSTQLIKTLNYRLSEMDSATPKIDSLKVSRDIKREFEQNEIPNQGILIVAFYKGRFYKLKGFEVNDFINLSDEFKDNPYFRFTNKTGVVEKKEILTTASCSFFDFNEYYNFYNGLSKNEWEKRKERFPFYSGQRNSGKKIF